MRWYDTIWYDVTCCVYMYVYIYVYIHICLFIYIYIQIQCIYVSANPIIIMWKSIKWSCLMIEPIIEPTLVGIHLWNHVVYVQYRGYVCIYIYIAMSRMARHCKCDWIILNSLCGGMSYDTQQCMCNNGSTRFQDQLVPQVSTLLSLKDSLTNRSNLSPQRPALLGNRGTSNDHLQSSSIPLNPEEVTSASDWGWLWWNSRGLWPSLDRSGLLVLLRTCNPSSPAGPQVPGLWHPDACNHSVDNYPFWSFIFQLLVDSYPNLSQAITLCDYLCLMIDIPLFDSRSSTHAGWFRSPIFSG